MRYSDFIVNYDPAKDKPIDVTRRILYSIFIRRLKHNKPAIVFISGDSGEGKSYTALRIQELLLEMQGLDIKNYINDINVYTPLEYPEKVKALINRKSEDWKRLKPINILCMHEAREIIKAKDWHSFLATSVADINASVRSVKRLCTIIVSQFIRDITTDIRYTLNFYLKVTRPMGSNRAKVQINVMWKDDRDLERPTLRRRRLMGYLRYPSGKMRRYSPRYLELRRPDIEITKVFDKQDKEAKEGIIKNKLEKLMIHIKKEAGIINPQLKVMVDHYTKNQEELLTIGKRSSTGKFKLRNDFRERHGLTVEELKIFNKMLEAELIKKGLAGAKNDT